MEDNTLNILKASFNEFKNQIAFYTAAASVFGSTLQIFWFLFNAPELIPFYSIKQGLIDGVFFFLVFIFSTIILTFLQQYTERIAENYSTAYVHGLVFSGYVFLAASYLYLVNEGYLTLALLGGFPGMLLLMSMFNSEYRKRNNIQVAINLQQRFVNAILFISITFLFILPSTMLSRSRLRKVYNFEEVAYKMDSNKGKWKYAYFNSDYVFFKNSKTKQFRIVKMEDITSFSTDIKK